MPLKLRPINQTRRASTPSTRKTPETTNQTDRVRLACLLIESKYTSDWSSLFIYQIPIKQTARTDNQSACRLRRFEIYDRWPPLAVATARHTIVGVGSTANAGEYIGSCLRQCLVFVGRPVVCKT